MADKTEPTPSPEQLAQANKKPKWLMQVEADAVRITKKRMKDEAEERAYKADQE